MNTDMIVGQLEDVVDTAQLPNAPGPGADVAFAIHYFNIAPSGGTVVAAALTRSAST